MVIELKRTDDGGHIELQAIRYAAMVSSMGFEEVVAAYAKHCAKHRPDDDVDARAELRGFLEVEDADDDPVISRDVRIVLVSAGFDREITTAVLWLNDFDRMDIRCVRLIPYQVDDRVLLDIQQVIPLPEAADYQVKLRQKDLARQRAMTESNRDLSRFCVVVDGVELPAENKRNSIRVMIQQLVAKSVPPSAIRAALPRPTKLRELKGALSGGEAVREAILADDPGADVRRWYCDDAHADRSTGMTYVLSNQWGLNTEPALEALAAAFTDTGVSFVRAVEQ